MKNTIKLLGIIAIIALIGLSFIGCDTGGDSPAPAPGPAGPPPPQKTVYTWAAGDDSYELVVTQSSEGRAVYTPKSGDTYVLTITPGNKRSSGTVAVSGNTFTLTPTGTNTTFTVTVTSTATNVLVTGMTGTITLTDNTTVTAPSTTTPTKVFETFDFKAHKWYYSETDCGETWHSSLPLSDFTARIPKKDDKFTFKVSGTIDKGMTWSGLNMTCLRPYQFLGGDGGGTFWKSVSGTFGETFVVTIGSDPHSNEVNVEMFNELWQITGDYQVTNGPKLPAGTQEGDVMATVRNFTISLEKVE